jgi:hypothetical protein
VAGDILSGKLAWDGVSKASDRRRLQRSMKSRMDCDSFFIVLDLLDNYLQLA